jgi:hypothetical protein
MSASRGIRGFIFFLSIYFVVGFGCSDDDNGGTGPITSQGPSDPFPAQGATDVPVISLLSWNYADSLAVDLRFALYIGTSNPPPLFRAQLSDTSFVIGPLNMDKEYYWKIIAYDLMGDTASSSTWKFRTASSFVFPATIGNRWDYLSYFAISDYDTIEGETYDTLLGASTVTITGLDTLMDTINALDFHTEWTEYNSSGSNDNYRVVRDDGMYLYAYDEGTWTGPPKVIPKDGIYYECKGMRFGNLADLLRTISNGGSREHKGLAPGPILEDPPIRELAYPLAIGQRWIFRDTDLGHVWNMEKEIISIDTVTVPAGTFVCYVVRWFWDMDGDGEWDTDVDGYDYISGAGTVKRILDYPSVYIINEFGDTLGVSDAYAEYNLFGYDLKVVPGE